MYLPLDCSVQLCILDWDFPTIEGSRCAKKTVPLAVWMGPLVESRETGELSPEQVAEEELDD